MKKFFIRLASQVEVLAVIQVDYLVLALVTTMLRRKALQVLPLIPRQLITPLLTSSDTRINGV